MKRNSKPVSKQPSRGSLVQAKDILNINHDEVYSFTSLQEVNLHQTASKVRPKIDYPSDYLNQEVPIYRVTSKKDIITALFSSRQSSPFFAHGELKGKFYQNSKIHEISNISFVGVMEGMFQWQQDSGQVYFEGTIQKIQFLTCDNETFQDKDLQTISLYESSFHGLFKGYFFPWSVVGGVQNIRQDTLVYIDARKTPNNFMSVRQENCNSLARSSSKEAKRRVEYFLPTLVCFEIKNIGDINLEKSSAVINGYLYLQIRYNSFLQQIFHVYRREKRKLALGLNFNRDVTLFLPLHEVDDDSDSNDSQWSIQDKKWDIQMWHIKEEKLLKYRILKRFRAEIDNTYGGFFAPFSLNRLKIVVSISSLKVEHEEKEVKLHFTCVDTYDNHPNQSFYNPFAHFNDLTSNNQVSSQQANRYYKINRHYCSDNGEYIIADNKLVLHPHFKNILKNKSFTNYDPLWNLGIRDFLYLLDPPLAQSIPQAFQQFSSLQQEEKTGKSAGFSMLNWDKVIIEVPIYKYIIIDMIKIFVPLTIITVMSLFIFNQENGVGADSHFTTLAMRLVNVAAIAIAYTTLIPIILSSLPKMPGITLVQIVTYLQTIPSLLAIVNSMFYYNIDLEQWRTTFRTFSDYLFLISFTLTLINFVILIAVFIGYSNMSYSAKWKINEFDRGVIKWRSPMYLRFMGSVMAHKGQYYTVTEENN